MFGNHIEKKKGIVSFSLVEECMSSVIKETNDDFHSFRKEIALRNASIDTDANGSFPYDRPLLLYPHF